MTNLSLAYPGVRSYWLSLLREALAYGIDVVTIYLYRFKPFVLYEEPVVASFREKYGIEGAVISAVDLTKGLGVYAGFEVINVPGATGWIDTNYVGKAEHALFALKTRDIVYLHVEAPDEAGHTGDVKNKIKAIEDFDELIVGNIREGMKQFDEYRILALPDHPTPLEIRTHSAEPVPFVLYDSGKERKGGPVSYCEAIAGRKDALAFEEGFKLMDHFLKK